MSLDQSVFLFAESGTAIHSRLGQVGQIIEYRGKPPVIIPMPTAKPCPNCAQPNKFQGAKCHYCGGMNDAD